VLLQWLVLNVPKLARDCIFAAEHVVNRALGRGTTAHPGAQTA
jgi:hypothetical protein